jgi:hypothetical protein
MRLFALGSVDKKDTLSFEKKNIFFEHATLLFKILIINITQIYVICKQKRKAGTEKHRQHILCQHFSVPAS